MSKLKELSQSLSDLFGRKEKKYSSIASLAILRGCEKLKKNLSNVNKDRIRYKSMLRQSRGNYTELDNLHNQINTREAAVTIIEIKTLKSCKDGCPNSLDILSLYGELRILIHEIERFNSLAQIALAVEPKG